MLQKFELCTLCVALALVTAKLIVTIVGPPSSCWPSVLGLLGPSSGPSFQPAEVKYFKEDQLCEFLKLSYLKEFLPKQLLPAW